MLNLGPKSASADRYVKDGTDASFATDVIESSHTAPVIVDFWAKWCGPCKTLGPAIESAVAKAAGKVSLIKIDVDRNQAVAAQLQVQSIPTVYAFWQGRPVDGFQGALPPSQVEAFVTKIAKLGGQSTANDGIAQTLEAAESMLAKGAAADAAQAFGAVLQAAPNTAAAYGGLARAYLALKETDRAKAILDGAPKDMANAPELAAARTQIALAKRATKTAPMEKLRASLANNADDHRARFDLAVALAADGNPEQAVAELLELVHRDRDWNDGAAKTQLFELFDTFKPNDPIAMNGRRRLSSLIFS